MRVEGMEKHKFPYKATSRQNPQRALSVRGVVCIFSMAQGLPDVGVKLQRCIREFAEKRPY
jgi:hypothetical protein